MDGTTGLIVGWRNPAHAAAMKKRIVSAFLWFYVGWYAGALIADIVGISPVLGPLLGAAAAALIVGDPRRLIWTARPVTRDNLPEPA